MNFEEWLVLAMACLALSFSPGPNSTFALTSSIQYGPRQTLKGILGGALGFMTLILAALLGLANFLTMHPHMMQGLKWAGCLYLFYLGFKLWNTHSLPEARSLNQKKLFSQGYLLAISNPKIILFWVAFIPTIMAIESLTWPIITLVMFTFAVIEAATETALAVGAKSAQAFLQKNIVVIEKTSAVIFAGFGLMIILN
jgi:threonine/homoserine/homoserine lactone efflux protein